MTMESLVVVLAEDDPGHAQLVQRNLQRAGVANKIVHVSDGEQALDYIHRRGNYHQRPANPLLLLLDVNMPRIGGVEVLRQVKQDQLLAKIPVIMLTTTDDPREIDRCYELGCNVYITKPVEYEALVEAIRRLGLLLQIVQLPVESHF